MHSYDCKKTQSNRLPIAPVRDGTEDPMPCLLSLSCTRRKMTEITRREILQRCGPSEKQKEHLEVSLTSMPALCFHWMHTCAQAFPTIETPKPPLPRFAHSGPEEVLQNPRTARTCPPSGTNALFHAAPSIEVASSCTHHRIMLLTTCSVPETIRAKRCKHNSRNRCKRPPSRPLMS